MAIIEEGSGSAPETAAERNARLQAAFNKAQQDKPPVPGVTTPDTPLLTQDQAKSAAIHEELYDPSFYGTTLPQENIHTELNTNPWGQFYSQGSSQGQGINQTTPSSWTEQELEMLGGMSVQDAINWGARYTGQALFGGWNVATGEAYTGAFDMETGELVNPSMMPSLLSPEFAHALGISDEQRVMMGYNAEYPYELQDIPAGSGGGAGEYDGYGGYGGGGGYSPSSGGYGYAQNRNKLTMWRIG